MFDKNLYKKWFENGNLSLSEERILTISNHISEGMYKCFTKKEVIEVAIYWMMFSDKLQQNLNKKIDSIILRKLRKLKCESK